DSTKKAAEAKPPGDQKTEIAIRSIRHWSSADVTHVAIDLGGQLQYKIGHLDDPERLFFDLYGAHLPEKVRTYKLNSADGFVSNIRVGDGEGVPRVALDLNTPVEYSATLIPEPYRLEITLHRLSAKIANGNPAPRSVAEPQPVMTGEVGKGANHAIEDPQVPPVPDATASRTDDDSGSAGNGGRSLVRALGLKIGRIVIDPGHGGDDTGGIGPTGLDEKD